MKTLTKRSISVVLAVLMMLSMMIIGGVSTNAAAITSDGTVKLYVNTAAVSWWNDGSAVTCFKFSGDSGTSELVATERADGNVKFAYIPEGTWSTVVISRHKSITDSAWNSTGSIALDSTKNYIESFSKDSSSATWSTYVEPVKESYTVYFKDTLGWGKAYAHFYSDSYSPSSSNGCSGSSAALNVDLNSIGNDVYSATFDASQAYKKVCFTKDQQNNYGNFHGTEAAYRTDLDFASGKTMFVPDTESTGTLNSNVPYYNNGEWVTYSEVVETTAPETTDPTEPDTTAPETTEPATTEPVTTEPATTETTVALSNYSVRGTFNDWNADNMPYVEDGIAGTTLELAAGTYKFKIKGSSSWYGNSGTIIDTTATSSSSGWVMSSSAGDCTLQATGGKYTFRFNVNTKALIILWESSQEDTTEATEPETTEPETTEPATTEPDTTAPVADTVTLYCECNQSWWNTDGAAVGVYYWGHTGDELVYPGIRMTPVEGETGLWSAEVPADATNIIFVRVNPSGDILDWGAKTADLDMPTDGSNKYTITSTSPVWGDPGVTGEWSVYGSAPAETEYTVVYSYTTKDGDQTLTKTVKTAETDATAIASLNVPTIVNPYYLYSLGECTLEDTTVNATLTAIAKEYIVTVDGEEIGKYGYKEKVTVGDNTYYVTGAMNIVTGADKEAAAISLDGLTVSDTKVSMDLLATANIENFDRMGVVFAASERTEDEITEAVTAVTTGTSVSNGIAVHNSTVDSANESGSYQFTYAPYVAKEKATKTLYFYTFAVDTEGNVSISTVVSVDLVNAVA